MFVEGLITDYHTSICYLCTEVDHKVAVSVDSTTSIPLGNLKLRHEDRLRLQPLLLRTKAFLEGSTSDLGSFVLPRTDLAESAIRKEIAMKAEIDVLRTPRSH